MTRVQLIHATSVAIPPIVESFQRLWPEAALANLLDDSLPEAVRDRSADAPEVMERFKALTRYAEACQADGILYTCSAFGAAIDAARSVASIPVL
ncbi:arylsulfatase, partial [Ralstonia pseudosolanacearum]